MALDIASIGTLPPPHPQAQNHPPVDAGLPGGPPAAAAEAKSLVPPPVPLIPSDLQETIKELQKLSAAFNRHLSFSVNTKLDSIVVKVVDSETDKVIREIPPAELQHVYEAIRETIGILFDDKA